MDNQLYIIGQDTIPSHFCLNDGNKINLTLIALPGTSQDVDIQVDINSPGCEIDIAALYLCKGDDKLNLNIKLRHNNGGSVSRQLLKGIVTENASAKFNGLIYVAKDSQKTKAFQENHTLLLSSEAKTESQPQLEIYADDVECSHGSTSGFLNTEELFYMRSRGIPEDEALKLQKIAFIAPIVARLNEDLESIIYDNIP